MSHVTQTFRKAYTRNFSIIMQQAWYAANKESLIKQLNLEEYPYTPPYIYFMKDGVEEVWENVHANNWLLSKVFEKINSEKEFFPRVYKRYFERLEKMEPLWKKALPSLAELQAFIKDVFEGVSDFVIIYAVLFSENVPTEYLEMARKFRERDAFFAECNIVIMNTLEKLYPELGHLAVYITYEELGNIPDKAMLQSRDAGFTLIPDIYTGTISFDDLIHTFPEYIFEIERSEVDIKELKGRTAFKGFAKGVVRIVKRKDQIELIKPGEIMISPMTTPDMVPAMEKAAAFVTDEGGITCHAAIIAREMKKPCVIGTKFATQVLKDGDVVEVDAEKGIITIIT